MCSTCVATVSGAIRRRTEQPTRGRRRDHYGDRRDAGRAGERLGDGNTSPDAVLGPASNQVRLRAERSGTGNGRVYRLAVTAVDELGLTCQATVRVSVPHDQAHPAVDSVPPSFDATLP